MKLLRNTLHERNFIEAIVDNEKIFWLNKKDIEEGLDHKNVWEITIKYHSDHRKHRCELVDETKKQCNRILIDENIIINIIMECRTTLAHKFRTRLELNNMMSFYQKKN